MEVITDKDRLDFLEAQKLTLWVGYDIPPRKPKEGDVYISRGGHCSWPIFGGGKGKLRHAIDRCIERSLEYKNDDNYLWGDE